jgi:hypothetical protein
MPFVCTGQTVLALDVLEHIPQYEQTVARLVQAVAPGGVIIERSPFYEADPEDPSPENGVTSSFQILLCLACICLLSRS